MQQRRQGPATRAGERFGARRSGLLRVLTAFVLSIAMLAGVLGAGRGTHCAQRSAIAIAAGHQIAASASDHFRAAPDQQAPAHDGSAPVSSQGCTSSIALPEVVMISVSGEPIHAPPLERLAALVATQEPPALFRPPRA